MSVKYNPTYLQFVYVGHREHGAGGQTDDIQTVRQHVDVRRRRVGVLRADAVSV